jgi:DNA-binding GntR family transcriptional regulator
MLATFTPPMDRDGGALRKGTTVYAEMRDLVLHNQLRPNEPLSGQIFAHHLRVSLTPVREALLRLASEGLLDTMPNRGFFMRPFSVEELTALFYVHRTLIVTCLKQGEAHPIRVTPRRSSTTSNGAEHRNGPDSQARGVEEAFLGMARLSNNPILFSIMDNLHHRTHVVRSLNFTYEPNASDISQSIDGIVDALSAGDSQRAITTFLDGADRNIERLPSLVKDANNLALSAPFP